MNRSSINTLSGLSAFLLVITLTLPAMAIAAPTLREPLREVFLFDCAGRYLRISIDGREVHAQGKLVDHLSAASGFDGCLVSAVQADPLRNLLYAAIAKDPRLDADGRRHYRVVALRLPDLQRLQTHEIDMAVEGDVRLLLSPERDELLVTYSRFETAGGQGLWRNVVEHLSAPDLRDIRLREDLRGESGAGRLPSSTALSPAAAWAGGGRILDRNLVLDDEGRVLQRLDPYELASPKMRRELRPFEREEIRGKRYLPMAVADSVGDRALFVVGHDTRQEAEDGRSALWVHDIGAGLTFRPVITKDRIAAYDPTRPETPTAHLTPDGDQVLVEQFEWRRLDEPEATEPMFARFKTGKLHLYDLAAGALARSIVLDPAPGFSARVIGYSPDGTTAFLGAAGRLYAVPLEGERAPSSHRIEGFEPFWTVGIIEAN
jgi:hypothetical protein